MSQGRPVITCDVCISRETAESLRGLDVWVAAVKVKVDEEREYLWRELIGRQVYDPSQAVVGSVNKICNYGTADIVVVVHAEKGELEIPLVETYFEMSFKRTDRHLTLVVPIDTFEGLWTKQNP